MKKSLFSVAMIFATLSVTAGGLLTNTNQNVAYLRNVARDASIEIDAVYSNPAGLAFLEKDGFHISLNNQSAWQTRTIVSTFKPFALNGGNETKTYEGKATAPFIPSLQAAYKKNKWVFSGSFAVVGGGGTLIFDKGLPSFEAMLLTQKTAQGSLFENLTKLNVGAIGIGYTGVPAGYSLDMSLKGSSIIYGAQLGATYKINDMFSAFVGGRINFVNNSYEGYLRNVQITNANGLKNHFTGAADMANGVVSMLQAAIGGGKGDALLSTFVPQQNLVAIANKLGKTPEEIGALNATQAYGAFGNIFSEAAKLASGAAAGVTLLEKGVSATDIELDSKQSGIGVTPIIGFDFNWKKLNIGVKYEFITKLDIKNNTKTDGTGLFKDGEKTPNDIPALLTIGAGYEILPVLRASAGFHYFFDKQAKMAADKQKELKHGTYEVLLGLEYDITKWLLVSASALTTQYGVTDKFQQDMSFSLSSFSYGFGAEVAITKDLKVNLAYFFTNYDDYVKKSSYNGQGEDTFKRTNKAFGIGVDYRF